MLRDYGASRAQELSNWKNGNKVSQRTLFDIIASQEVTFSDNGFQVYNQYPIQAFLDAMIELIRSCLLLSCAMYHETSETRMH